MGDCADQLDLAERQGAEVDCRWRILETDDDDATAPTNGPDRQFEACSRSSDLEDEIGVP